MVDDEEAADGNASVSIAVETENDETTNTTNASSTCTTTTTTAAAAATPLISHTQLFAAVEESILTPRPIVDFFYHPTANGDDAHDYLTIRERRDAICNIVRSSKLLNKARARRLFAGLGQLLRKVVEEESFTPSDMEEEGVEKEEDEEDKVLEVLGNAKEASRAVLFLRCCAFLVEAYLEGILTKLANNSSGRRSTSTRQQQQHQKIDIIDEAYEVAELLHDSLFPLQNCCGTLIKEAQHTQSAIFGMCERYWHGNFEDREQMVTQLIPLLLVKSLDDTAQKNDVKRLYSIRDAIHLLDFEDESSIASLKMHLLRTVNNPLFLQSAEGRKFIAHLFTVDASLVLDLHRAIRTQIVGAKKSILNAYADIYYMAWKASTEKEEEEEENRNDDNDNNGQDVVTTKIMMIQTSIEENALQDLMYQVIHAAVPSTARSVRTVLDKFYLHKKIPNVEGMLHRMYGPLLWRALVAANSTVRKQASVVLADTFPLRDPEAGEEWTEACVRKSVIACAKLMEDDVPSVRVAGSMAAARIMREFWVVVPSQDIRMLLNHIIAKHASDASSSAVRAAAVNAVITLLEEDKTHGVLRPLLPSLGNLIHDKTEKVRLAVVNMLLCIKKLRGMKYYHVVPANHLLARLAEEGRGMNNNNPRGPVAVGLSNLLGNSFFPTGSKRTMADIINRTLRLLGDSPGAAVAFYRNASSQLSVNSISRLIAALMKCLCFFIVEEKKKNAEDVGDLSLVFSPEDQSIEYKGGGGQSNTALMATIAESVSILWESIEPQLKDPQNENAEEMLTEVFSGNVLTEVYCHFEAKFENNNHDDNSEEDDAKLLDCSRACVAILNCAGKVDESKIEGLRSRIIDELSETSDMPAARRMKVNLSPNVALLCAWGMAEDVATCLASSITEYFAGDGDELDASFTRKSGTSRKRKQSPKRKVKVDKTRLPKLDIDVCLGILGHILKGSTSASVSAREFILKSDTACDTIVTALQSAKDAAERMMKPRISNGSEMSPTMIKHIGISIECYGRLIIHKEAMKCDIPIKLSPEAKSLMTWVTDTIVPTLNRLVRQEADVNPLRDLDLSSILSAASPSLDRNSSSPTIGNLGDTSFITARGSLNLFEDKSKFVSTRAVAITAMSSILCTFAEWLSVRFVGDSFAMDQISTWCKLLECSDSVVRKTLLQLCFHIAITSLKNEGDPALLQEVLSSMKNVDPCLTEIETISYAMASVISFRDERILKAATTTIVDLTRIIVLDVEEEDESGISSSLLDKVGPCMRKVIECFLSEKQSCLILAKCLIHETKPSSVRECLLREVELRSPRTGALEKVLRKWEAENITADPANDDKKVKNINLNDYELVAA